MGRIVSLRASALWAVALALALCARAAGGSEPRHCPAPGRAPAALSQEQRVLHALNRLAFGPRPGDVERVRRIGLSRWIERQLSPEQIDDTAVDEQIARLQMLRFPPDQLALAWAVDQPVFARALRAPGAEPASGTPPPPMNPQQRLVLQQIRQAKLEHGASFQAVGELVDAKLARAIGSERQLQEVLVDFWTNHFNLDVRKGVVRTYRIADERDVIRPHVLGRFRDLLGASAKSPAMLFYLDNFQSTRDLPAGVGPGGRPRATGLNENYAREIMELHTLGVDGGYTQKDVQEVARCLTGWGIDREGNFQFNRRAHDDREKVVVGHRIPPGRGIEDGERVLDLLAGHPSTARFLARKLCVRFVSDDPPPALVQRVAAVYLRTGGDLKAVTRAVVTSKEFFSPEAFRAKVKSPFEFAVSAVRALGATYQVPDSSNEGARMRLIAEGGASWGATGHFRTLAREISGMGQPLYAYQAPTGYPEDSRAWASAGGLMSRLNFVLALVTGRMMGVQVPPYRLTGAAGPAAADEVVRQLPRQLGVPLSPRTQVALKQHLEKQPEAAPAELVALVLGAPEFQRR